MIFGIIFDRADESGLLPWRQILVMGYFLSATENVRAMSKEDVNFGLFVWSKKKQEKSKYL